MAIDLVALATEINTDPTGRGYAPHITSGNDGEIAILLNEVQAGINIQRSSLTSPEIFEATDLAEYRALTAQSRQMYQVVVTIGSGAGGPSGGGIPVGPGTNARLILAGLFPAGSTTRANLVALVMRTGSRGEELFGENVVVSSKDVAMALRRT